MQKFLRLSSLDAFDPLPSLGGRVPTPAKAAPPALAPVPGRPHLWRTPAGALAYLPPPPGTPRMPGATPKPGPLYRAAPRVIPRSVEENHFNMWMARPDVVLPHEPEAVQAMWEASADYTHLYALYMNEILKGTGLL